MKNIKNISSTSLSSHEYDTADIAKGRERKGLIEEREKKSTAARQNFKNEFFQTSVHILIFSSRTQKMTRHCRCLIFCQKSQQTSFA
jgi:hypothetical protein